MVSTRKFKFVEKMPTQFSFEVLGNQMRYFLLCKVYSSGGTLRFGTLSWKYPRSKLALAGVLHAVVRYANGVSAENETKNMPFQFSSYPKAKWIFRFRFVFRVLVRGNFDKLLFQRPLLPRSPIHAQSVFFSQSKVYGDRRFLATEVTKRDGKDNSS